MPEHIAIIMDGNGRWAKERHRPRFFGHVKGARVAKKIITKSVELKLKNLTLYAFSTENWSRPADEVNFLMRLLRRYLERERHHLFEQNIRFRVIGNIEALPGEVVHEIKKTIAQTASNTGLNLTFALNYGGRQELTALVQSLVDKVLAGEIDRDEITESRISEELRLCSVVDPDLIIRTSGELRLSNFLTWQSAYSELFFTSVLWPDFEEGNLLEAIQAFRGRQRRFGQTADQVNPLNTLSRPRPGNENLKVDVEGAHQSLDLVGRPLKSVKGSTEGRSQ